MRTPRGQFFLHDFDTGLLGFVVDQVTGHRSAPSREVPTAEIPGRLGPLRLSSIATVQSRLITVSGHVVADDVATALANWRTLKRRAGASLERRLRFADAPDRYFVGRLRQAPATLVEPEGMVLEAQGAKLEFECDDPRELAVAPFSIATGAPIPLGDAPSHWTLTFTAGASPTTVSLVSGAGVVLYSATLTGTGTFVVDSEAQTVTLGGIHVPDAVEGHLWWALDPDLHADVDAGLWPRITLSAGAGLVAGRRAWW